MAEQYACRVLKAERNSGSGLVFQLEQTFWNKLLQEPSCLLQKYGPNTFESRRFYVLLTAHSNIYGEEEKEQPVMKYIEEGEISLAFGGGSSGRRLALRDCVARTAADGSERCVAVTCCGADSILVLCSYEDLNLSFTLKSHSSPEKCSINSNFLLLFLKAEAVHEHLTECNPPSLGEPTVAQLAHEDAEILWRDESGVVQKKALTLLTIHSREVETESLAKKEEEVRQLQTIGVTTETPESSCCIGAPIVQAGSSPTIIGFYSGENKMTTIYGIFTLLKGGVEYFLAAMNAKQTSTSISTLMPSRWEYHITRFLEGIHTRSSIFDLLHFLLHQDEVRQLPILKCDLKGGPPKPEILAVLNILTSIFLRYKDLKKAQDTPYHGEAKLCTENYGCLRKITDILKQLSHHFARSDNRNSDIVEALFQCVEKMQHFNYINIGEETLKEIRTDLDEMGKKNSSAAINECFKWIDILDRERARDRSSQQPMNDDIGCARWVW